MFFGIFHYILCFRHMSILSFLLLAGVIAGCSTSLTGGPDRITTRPVIMEYLQSGLNTDQFHAYRAATGTQKKELRNSIVLSAMGVMDVEYTRFEQNLTRERQQLPFLATAASIALSGTGALIDDSVTKSTLAAVDTALKGTKESYDKEILANQTIAFLQTQMRTNRNNVRSRILAQLSEPADVYPLELAMVDLEDYYSAGTITGGLIGINEETADKFRSSEEKRITSINRFGPNNSTETIRQALEVGGSGAVDELKKWLGVSPRDLNIPIVVFLNSAQYADLRDEYAATLTSSNSR